MNTETQFRAAYVVSLFSGVMGFIVVGLGLGFALSVQTTVGAGCPTIALTDTLQPCQQAMETMGDRATLSSLLGVALIAIGGGSLYYLRQQVP